jgi:outer membrane protein W
MRVAMKNHRSSRLVAFFTRRSLISSIVLAAALAGAPCARAQFGIGAGVAAMGDNVIEAGVNLGHLFADSLQYGDIGGVVGGYVIGHFRYGYGSYGRLNLDVSYVFFPAETIRLVKMSESSNEAVFEVGANLIPIALGGEVVLPNEHVRPYLGAQVSYTIFNRTFAYVQGNEAFNRDDIRSEWAGHDRWGLAFRGGAEFALGDVALDLGLRYNLASLFNAKEGENGMNYLQVGLSVLFGELVNTREEEVK